MPAAAVIPAPIVYFKVVEVKKLVVEFAVLTIVNICPGKLTILNKFCLLERTFTVNKLKCSKQAIA